MGTAEVKQATLLPPLCQNFQLVAEYRPVSVVVPALGYLIKYVYFYLTPFIPFPSEERGKNSLEGGLRPLSHSPFYTLKCFRTTHHQDSGYGYGE